MQVVVDEEQFKLAGRKLAAHLADPEVEVRTLYLVISFEDHLLSSADVAFYSISEPGGSHILIREHVSREYTRQKCHYPCMLCCRLDVCVRLIQRRETVR